ncbi:MAG TPA: porphobilinogen synthase [Chloroflexota bacterium]
MTFPATRMRRLRRTPALRTLARETRLAPDQLIYPIFVQPGRDRRDSIPSMPGQNRLSVDLLPRLIRELDDLGIGGVVLFGLPEHKDEVGSGAYDPEGIIQQAIRTIKDALPDALVIADTCLDEYTSHGHCGIIRDGEVDNDATLEVLARIATSQAAAGADVVAPSDMMDGRIGAIRTALDADGRSDVPIMAYAAKYASVFYGPFRDAADCAPKFGDRRSYQMDPANRREALREVELDVEEGADIVMVKPALPYLDIIREVRDSFDLPLAAYNVSGEYAMLKAAAEAGWLAEGPAVLETLTSIRRAGADIILTYHACEAARWLHAAA